MRAIHPLSPYRHLEDLHARQAELTAQLGPQAQLITLGRSVLGRPLLAAHLPNPSAHAPHLLLCANIHGVEYIGAEVALGFLEALASPAHPQAAKLRAQASIWVIPTLNPDAYAKTWILDGGQRLADVRCNASGVDLNRNYPRPAPLPKLALSLGGWGTGAAAQGSAFYRGPEPLSEPETRAVDALMRRHRFIASASLHSAGGVFFPAHVKTQRELWRYRRLCLSYARAQPYARAWPLSSACFDWFTGEQEDHLHHVYGCWSICVEVFGGAPRRAQLERRPGLFWRFNPQDPKPWVDNEVPGLISYFLAALRA